MIKHIDLIHRATWEKGAKDGGAIRKACKATCDGIDYGVTGIYARIAGLNDAGRRFCSACPTDCVVEIIGGEPAIYQAEVVNW